MKQPMAREMGLSLAWRFTDVFPGSFERDRAEVAGITFPIVGLNRPGFRGGRLVLDYLRYVIERINDYPVNRVAELQRWAIGQQLVPAATQAAAA